MLDAHSGYDAVELLPAARRTSTTNGSGVDVRDYHGRGKVTLSTGTVTGTTPTQDVKIQDSADNSAFADLSPNLAFVQQTVAGKQEIQVDLDTVRRYIRAVATIAGTTPSFDSAVILTARKQNRT
jgi:hypothetical protein